MTEFAIRGRYKGTWITDFARMRAGESAFFFFAPRLAGYYCQLGSKLRIKSRWAIR